MPSIPFTTRLLEALSRRSLSQSKLAEVLGISRSTITGWLRYGKLPDADLIARLCAELRISADWLLGLDTHIEKHDPSGAIHWIEQIPPHITGIQREQLEYGVRLFNSVLIGDKDIDAPPIHNWRSTTAALQSAVRSGAIRLASVARNAAQEHELLARFPALKDVVVADVPTDLDNTIVRTELVGFLAATQVLNQAIRPASVGLGSGYTMLRFCENSIPSIDQFTRTNWTPLLAFYSQNSTDYTADYLACMMSVRHPGSVAVRYLADSESGEQPSMTRLWQDAHTLFMSVSGVDRRDFSGTSHIFAQFRSADYLAEAPDLRTSYTQLENKRNFGAELLRYLLDTDGNIIARDPAVTGQIDLDILRYNSTGIGKVCIIAAKRYKAKAVLTCIRARLANSLVIDSEIAQFLLDNA